MVFCGVRSSACWILLFYARNRSQTVFCWFFFNFLSSMLQFFQWLKPYTLWPSCFKRRLFGFGSLTNWTINNINSYFLLVASVFLFILFLLLLLMLSSLCTFTVQIAPTQKKTVIISVVWSKIFATTHKHRVLEIGGKCK